MKTIHYIPTTTLLVDKYLYIYIWKLFLVGQKISVTPVDITSPAEIRHLQILQNFLQAQLGRPKIPETSHVRNGETLGMSFGCLRCCPVKIQTSNIFKTIGNVIQYGVQSLVEWFHQGKRAPQFVWTSNKRSAKSRKSTREMAGSKDFINQNVELTTEKWWYVTYVKRWMVNEKLKSEYQGTMLKSSTNHVHPCFHRYTHDGSMVLVYMLTWLGYIDGKCYHIWHPCFHRYMKLSVQKSSSHSPPAAWQAWA